MQGKPRGELLWKTRQKGTVSCRRDLGIRLWPSSGVVGKVLITLWVSKAEPGDVFHGKRLVGCRMQPCRHAVAGRTLLSAGRMELQI